MLGPAAPSSASVTLHLVTRWQHFSPPLHLTCAALTPGAAEWQNCCRGVWCVIQNMEVSPFWENHVSASCPCAAGWLLVLGITMKKWMKRPFCLHNINHFINACLMSLQKNHRSWFCYYLDVPIMFLLDEYKYDNEYLPLIFLQHYNAFCLISHLLLLQSSILFT